MVDQAKNGKSQNGTWMRDLNWPTVVLILLTGGGNFLATKDDGRLTREESQRVIYQVQQSYNALQDFERRQKETLDRINQALENDGRILAELRQQKKAE